jgi:tetratricopeptide (TPR) repeat protein
MEKTGKRPDRPRIKVNNLGSIANKRTGDYTKGISYIKEAAELQPEDPPILFSLGSAYKNAGNYRQAAEYISRALAIVPDNLDYIR